jgi:integrase
MSVRRDNRKTKTGTKGVWVVDIVAQLPNGTEVRERKQSSRWSRREAEAYERQLLFSIVSGTYQRKEDRKEIPTLDAFSKEFIESYAKVHNKPNEVRSKLGNLRRYLLPALGKKRLNDIKVRDVEKLKGQILGKGLSPKTVNNALATLGKMLRYAEEIEIIDKVPRIRLLKAPTADFDFLTFGESKQLLDAAKYNPEWHAMIFIALRTGLRYGELSELRWTDVDLKNGRLMVRRSYSHGHVTTPKSGRQREIPLSDQTVAFLKKHRHLKSELVFCKEDGGRHIHRRGDVALKRCCRYAGLRKIGWHTLRHTFASHLAMKGVSLKSIQELLGHATMEMTMRYAHLSPEVNKTAVATLDDESSDCKVTAT